jgi:hypothetical protein
MYKILTFFLLPPMAGMVHQTLMVRLVGEISQISSGTNKNGKRARRSAEANVNM